MEQEQEILYIDEDEQLAENINLVSPMYAKQRQDCLLCTYHYLSDYESQISTFKSMLTAANCNLGCVVFLLY